MTTIGTVIDRSARLLGIDTLTSAEQADMIEALNVMLYEWAVHPGMEHGGVYSATDDQLSLPPEYETAIKYNLAVDYASEHGLSPSAVVAARAVSSLGTVRAMALSSSVPTANTLPFSRDGYFDIETGEYI